ncbi:MAG: cysteine hydrolase family protein [Candidatus Glassbacteria bacterium]
MDDTKRRNEALIVVDMLNDFVLEGAPLEVNGAREIIPAVRKRIAKARKSEIPVIYLCDNHSEDDPEFRVWPRHAVTGSEGSKVVQELAPAPSDRVVKKTTYSGFHQTDLDLVLKELGIERLTITGVCTSICVLYTAVDALMRGYEVDVPEDSVAGLSHEDHAFALRQVKEVLIPRKYK